MKEGVKLKSNGPRIEQEQNHREHHAKEGVKRYTMPRWQKLNKYVVIDGIKCKDKSSKVRVVALPLSIHHCNTIAYF